MHVILTEREKGRTVFKDFKFSSSSSAGHRWARAACGYAWCKIWQGSHLLLSRYPRSCCHHNHDHHNDHKHHDQESVKAPQLTCWAQHSGPGWRRSWPRRLRSLSSCQECRLHMLVSSSDCYLDLLLIHYWLKSTKISTNSETAMLSSAGGNDNSGR